MKTKKWKRIAAALLAGILVIGSAGCGEEKKKQTAKEGEAVSTESSGEEGAKGRYVETLKETPDGVTSIENMIRLSDGSAAFIGNNNGKMYFSKDNGASWKEKELPSLEEKSGIEEIEITSKAIAPDGGVFYSYVDWSADYDKENSSVREHYVYIDKDGKETEITLKDESGSFNFYLSKAVFIGEKELAGVLNGGSVYRISLETGTVSEMGMPDADMQTVFAAGDYLMSSEQIFQISAKSIVEDSVLTEFIREETKSAYNLAVCYDSGENTLYLATASGLFSHVAGGSSMEKLLDGGLCTLGDPTKTAASILKNEDGSFLIAYEDGEIDLYAYDKDALAVPKRELSIYSLEENMTVSRAVSIFRKSNPDVYVKQEIGLSGDYGMTKEDAIRNLNTRLLAGEGPDLLLLDGLPMDSYIEKGILADLTETMEETEKNGSYYSGVLKAYQTKKGLYAVPVRFRIPVVIGEQGSVESVKDINALAEAVKSVRTAHPNSNTVLGTFTAQELLKRLYEVVSCSLKNGEEPDREEILNFLTKANEIYIEEQKNITPELTEMHNNTMTWMEEYGTLKAYENLTLDASLAMDLMCGNQLMMIGKLSGMDDFKMLESILKNKEGFSWRLVEGTSGPVFSPNGIAGINDKSDEQELAVSFLRELLGESVQKSDLNDGFPVNADAWEAFTENPRPGESLGFTASVEGEDGTAGERVNFEITWPSEEELAGMKKKIETLIQPSLPDGVIFDAVTDSGVKVLEGGLTADEGCDEIVQKVGLYLAE